MGDGVQHHEVMTAKGDVLTIKSIGGGFVAIFDHGRVSPIMKNQFYLGLIITHFPSNLPKAITEEWRELATPYFNIL